MSTEQGLAAVSAERELRYLELLLEAGEILDRSLNYHETLENVCDAAVRTIADICLFYLGTGDDLHLAAASGREGIEKAQLLQAGKYLRQREDGRHHPVWDVVALKTPMLIAQIDEAYILEHSVSAEHAAFMRRSEYRSAMVVPLISKTQGMLGALTFIRTRKNQAAYDHTDLRFAIDLARRCSAAIAKALLYAQTEHIARRFQHAALPRSLPETPGIALDGFYEPSSEELLVGGDWYDAFLLPDGRLAITVGDVLGHGLDAAVWMGRLRNCLRATLYTDPDPGRALSVVDRLMQLDADEDRFGTALVALLDPARQTLTCVSAGHPGPLIWETNGSVVDPFTERRVPLGMLWSAPSTNVAQTVTLHPGAFAVFFTDGLLEWNRDAEASWNVLVQAMRCHEIRETEHPARAVRDAVIDDQRHQDDVAVFTVRVDQLP